MQTDNFLVSEFLKCICFLSGPFHRSSISILLEHKFCHCKKDWAKVNTVLTIFSPNLTYSFINPPSSLSIHCQYAHECRTVYRSMGHLSGFAPWRDPTLPHAAATNCQVLQLWVGLQEPLPLLHWDLSWLDLWAGLVFTLISCLENSCVHSIFIGHKQEASS